MFNAVASRNCGVFFCVKYSFQNIGMISLFLLVCSFVLIFFKNVIMLGSLGQEKWNTVWMSKQVGVLLTASYLKEAFYFFRDLDCASVSC